MFRLGVLASAAVLANGLTCNADSQCEYSCLEGQCATKKQHKRHVKDLEKAQKELAGHKKCKCVGAGTGDVDTSEHYDIQPVATHCASWDADHSPSCAVESPPDWCAQKWCIVDADKCRGNLDAEESSYYPGLYFSYTTCGAQDVWTGSEEREEVTGEEVDDKQSKKDAKKAEKAAKKAEKDAEKEAKDAAKEAEKQAKEECKAKGGSKKERKECEKALPKE